jgi:hypothetical protein
MIPGHPVEGNSGFGFRRLLEDERSAGARLVVGGRERVEVGEQGGEHVGLVAQRGGRFVGAATVRPAFPELHGLAGGRHPRLVGWHPRRLEAGAPIRHWTDPLAPLRPDHPDPINYPLQFTAAIKATPTCTAAINTTELTPQAPLLINCKKTSSRTVTGEIENPQSTYPLHSAKLQCLELLHEFGVVEVQGNLDM